MLKNNLYLKLRFWLRTFMNSKWYCAFKVLSYSTVISLFLIVTVLISGMLLFIGILGSGGGNGFILVITSISLVNVLTFLCYFSPKFLLLVPFSYIFAWYVLMT